MNRPLPDNQYPDAIISGDVIGVAYRAIRARLTEAFDPRRFTHHAIPARATVAAWKNITRKTPLVAVGWNGWNPDRDCTATYRGTLLFPVFLLVSSNVVENLYVGAGPMPGVFGMCALATAMLHGFTIPDIGTCHVTANTAAIASEWIPEGTAAVGLDVSIPDVELDTAALLGQLDDFLRLGETFVTDGAVAPEVTLDVRNP